MSQTNDKSDRGIGTTTVSTEVQETLVDEVLSAARTYNLSGRYTSVKVVVDAETGEVVWKGRLGAGEHPAYEWGGITIDLSATNPFCSREQVEEKLNRDVGINPHINLE